MVLKLDSNSKRPHQNHGQRQPTLPPPPSPLGWVLMGELGRVSSYRSRGVGDTQRRRHKFSGVREAQHIDEGQLDHRMLSSGKDNSPPHTLYTGAGREEAQMEAPWTWISHNIVFSAYVMNTHYECSENTLIKRQGSAACFTNITSLHFFFSLSKVHIT